MTRRSKAIALLCSVALACSTLLAAPSALASPPSTSKDAGCELSAKRFPTKMRTMNKVIRKGKSFRLYLDNVPRASLKNVKWRSTNRRVATVSKTGAKEVVRIKAKRAGTAKIVAKVGGKRYICKVVVHGKRHRYAIPIKKVVHHDAVYDSVVVCGYCGEKNIPSGHIKHHVLDEGIYDGVYTYVTDLITTPAYDETVIIGHRCACGAKRAA